MLCGRCRQRPLVLVLARSTVAGLGRVGEAGDVRSLLAVPRAFARLASAMALVRVVPRQVEAARLLHVPVGCDGVTAVAAIVLLVARYNLLRGELLQIPRAHEEGRLDLLRGAEGPAAAAVPLVLHRCEGALLAPVHGAHRGEVGIQGKHLHVRAQGDAAVAKPRCGKLVMEGVRKFGNPEDTTLVVEEVCAVDPLLQIQRVRLGHV
mmetsp:Transcript_141536/g.439993  ORF Transcript_141536/g.439993 Transcript_141536/m.439993 type:complete len:207 (+) Transcript_141536:462-1082(+)